MKHTQGKWNVKEARENLNGLSSFVSYQVVNDDEVVIAKETTEANANLIAAAPEMLKSLKLILDECRAVTVTGYHNKLMNIWEMAEETIAKAEGE
jgi:activator of 2-hydroxyglutaryl-CoA dehydratase